MDLMKLIGTVLAVCYHPGCALKGFSSQRICRRGIERPCYKIAYHQDSTFRVGFEEARWACREDDGELLSIESENEQKLVEKFVRGSQVAYGDFWIGLRRNQGRRGSGAGDCLSHYYWLDRSRTTYRNWLFEEPSCGSAHCVALYHRPSASAPQQGSRMFKWIHSNCNIKNNFICKYSEEKSLVPTAAGNSSTRSDVTLKPKQLPATSDYEKVKTGFSESSVTVSDASINVYYILLGTVPVLLLLILVVSVVLCYRVVAKKKTEQNEIYAVPGQWLSSSALKNTSAYAPKKIPTQHVAHLEYMSSEISRTYSITDPSSPSLDYENVPSGTTGFVTNAIYETCRPPAGMEAGWVENDIYG
ncbi:layilin [Trichomycterus rosablanca]|uniref:layilin n=1 Tax=Trichomycterus rosablanca TaxID=2290929 RepID=UPI002F35A6C5